jgi:hypothetical protein
MRSAEKLGIALRAAAAAAAFSAAVLSGCGMPAAPHPPSLELPEPVTDLAAIRTGDQVSLTWTMPRRDTDKVLLKCQIAVRICRRSSDAEPCATAGTVEVAPQASGAFTETLPTALAAGAPRALSYFVELNNRKGRSAGLSNAAMVVAGQAPGAVTGLSAEARKDGMVLRWTTIGTVSGDTSSAAIRLQRKLITPPAKAQSGVNQNGAGQNVTGQGKPAQGLLAPEPTPAEQNLLVETGLAGGRAPSGIAIDKQIQFGEVYEYRAQRVQRVTVAGKALELDGPFSAPVRVEAADVFPPETPTGLAAVATVGGNGGETAIDLSWQPNTEADLAGYAVYRREAGGAWQHIAPAQPVVGPGFHDASVQAGHTYEYAVTAIDQGGRESHRSKSTQETVPGP